MIVEKLSGRNFFITGVTGFLGKIILEKLLRSIPNIGTIYLLIRTKKDISSSERLTRLIKSRVFNRLRGERNDFEEYATQHLRVIGGDVAIDKLGMSDEDIEIVKQNVNIIIHSAATINFTERLVEAVKLNVLGSLRLLSLAKQCRKMEAFTHISTAYVNCNKKGTIEEILYPLDFDANEMLKTLLDMDPLEMDKNEQQLISGYPNTYTFTKSLTEHLLAEKREHVPLLIFRPSIIGASYKEPAPGWLDTVSAASALYVTAGMGIMKFMLAHRPDRIGDQVPADIVSNALIVATADIASQFNRMNVIHVGTSKNKPLTWRFVKKIILPYLLKRPPKRTFSKPSFFFVTSDTIYNSLYFFQYRVPISAFNLYARFLGTEEQLKQAQLWGSFEKRIRKMVGNFNFFVNNEWIFDTANTYEIWNKLTEEEQTEFPFDISKIDWEEYLLAFCYGMKLNILREEGTIYPLEDRNCPMYLRADLGADFWWAFSGGEGVNDIYKINPPEKMRSLVLFSPRVQEAIRNESRVEGAQIQQVEDRARELIDVMAGTINMGVMRTEGYFFRKFYRYMYQGIYVDELGIKRVAEAAKKGPIVLIPTHRSYLDFLLTSFIFHDHDLPVPRIAAGDDFLNMKFVSWIFRNSGAFFMRRSYGNDHVYKAIFSEYICRIITYGHPLEFFIEGTRSRTGKSLPPKFGVLSIIVNAILDGGLPDVSICPITLSYERIVEEESHGRELSGEVKSKPTTTALVQTAFSKLLHQNYGRINVQFAEPIGVADYVKNFYKSHNINQEDDKNWQAVISLGYEIIESFHREMVIMSPALVAAITMVYRAGIAKDLLIEKFGWLKEELILRGARLDPIEGSNLDVINHVMPLLSNLLVENRNIIAVEISTRNNSHVLQLSMYRNQILHILQREGIAALALISFGNLIYDDDKNGGVAMKDFLSSHAFISKLFRDEFVDRYRDELTEKQKVEETVMLMVERNILSYNKKSHKIKLAQTPNSLELFKFLCELFWPFVDCMWVAATTLFSLQNKRVGLIERLLIERMQWFAEKCYHEKKLYYWEACCKDTLRNSILLFTEWEVITTNESSSIELTEKYNSSTNLNSLVDQISAYRNSPDNPKGGTNLGRNTFPLLARL